VYDPLRTHGSGFARWPAPLPPSPEVTMKLHYGLLVVVALSLAVGVAHADFPLMNLVADKVIQRYQQSSCQQLAEKRTQPKTEQEQRVVQLMRNDPQLAKAFLDKVAAPIANKMFECGLIP
jgi:hypothetical protein